MLDLVIRITELLLLSSFAYAQISLSDCDVAANIESGYVCGRIRKDANGEDYASFRAIPYAKQPLGELRFQELQPLEPFTEVFDATEDGPVCPQIDTFYGPMMRLSNMSEDCIRISVHVPAWALPPIKDTEDYYYDDETEQGNRKLLPIFVFIHGGSFVYGAGYADYHGPEYLMTKDVILVTFNYRLNIPGFLSLNSTKIPGNNGLRDALTALHWVQRNAKFFGGDPDEVTVGGQSAGGAMAHLLSISPAVKGKGLIKRVITSSGLGTSNFYSYSPSHAKKMGTKYLMLLGINPSEDPDEIHRKLVELPIEVLLKAGIELRNLFAWDIAFCPVIETPVEGFTTILPDSPEKLVDEGYGKEFPLLLGFNSNECQTQVKEITPDEIKSMPTVANVPVNIRHTAHPSALPLLTYKILDKYIGALNKIQHSNLFSLCAASYYIYPIMRTTKQRLAVGAESTFIYKFGYHGENSIMKKVLNVDFPGATHTEDITYFLRLNHFLGPVEDDEMRRPDPDSRMREWMTTLIASFIKTGNPSPKGEGSNDGSWQATRDQLKYQRIYKPMKYDFRPPSLSIIDMKHFFDELYTISKGSVDNEDIP